MIDSENDVHHAPISAPSTGSANARAYVDLELERINEAVAMRTQTPMGKAAANALEPLDLEGTERARILGMEALALHNQGEPLPVRTSEDVTEAIKRLGVAGVLSGPELRAVADVLSMARTLRRFFAHRAERQLRLSEVLATDPSLDRVEDEVRRCFDPDGTLSDAASPRLRELRAEHKVTRERMLSRLDAVMQKYGQVLQDNYVTEREGRYVLPVRSDSHERFPGIVHTTSATGATLFVEPRVVVPLGNRLKMLEGDLIREEHAIYAQLSGHLYEKYASVEAAAQAIARADLLKAIAVFAEDLGLRYAEFAPLSVMNLQNARHPLLLLDCLERKQDDGRSLGLSEAKKQVVPSDLCIESGRALVVSGPNAGGKTVALKTMGLSALMTRMGLPVSCLEGSTVGYFAQVLTDVGDDQSLQKNLSTFSAHIRNMAQILSETSPQALILLDELCGGTDPREGEALAAGILDSLCARGGATVVTTHYEGLKALAVSDGRFRNASVGFDQDKLSPTFQLQLDVPGRSSALAVAKRHGMPSTVIERADRFLSHDHQSFEDVVKRLNEERAGLEFAKHALLDREREMRETKAEVERELERAKERARKALDDDLTQLEERLRRARQDLHEAQAVLRERKNDREGLREASKKIDQVAQATASVRRDADADTGALPVAEPKPGMKIKLRKLGREGEILELVGDKHARVTVGVMKLLVDRSELLPIEDVHVADRVNSRNRKRGMQRGEQAGLEVALQTTDNTCDVRGMRADDALAMTVSFLDRSIGERRQVVFIVHGHGTGALRDQIRQELTGSPYVAYFRAGGPHEGGDGATVVWLS
jgi:DNA mismatch repair protein MutS2